MNLPLQDLKVKFSRQVEWGAMFSETVEAPGAPNTKPATQQVLRFAWKDANIVLFASTVGDPHINTMRDRKRPSAARKDPQLRKIWGNEGRKVLSIPELIDWYNHRMGGVDIADQYRACYNISVRSYRTWRPLWNYLFQTVVCNAALLFIRQPSNPSSKKSGHKKFRDTLAAALMLHSTSKPAGIPSNGIGKKIPIQKAIEAAAATVTSIEPSRYIVLYSENVRMDYITLPGGHKACSACQASNRDTAKGTERKALGELSLNSIVFRQEDSDIKRYRKRRPPRSSYGCRYCKVRLCRTLLCWNEHLDACRSRFN